MLAVRLEHLTRRFGPTLAVQRVSQTISAGELFFLLGPSGCGKSTLLRMIAGLLEPTEGKIFIGDRDVTALETERRNAVMCFQGYALWPHMTVRQNVAFGLRVRGVSEKNRVDEMLRLVQLEAWADRKPGLLSGGQQQRVALARALAVRPDCLLLDEPLSNLDAQLRQDMRGEIRRICKSAGVTTIYVTHDQKEALAIADRIAVMDRGQVVQVAQPAELYDRPANRFVAQFLGQTNLIAATVLQQNGPTLRLQTPLGEIRAAATSGEIYPSDVFLSIRPERIRLSTGHAENRLTGKLIETIFLGETAEYRIDVAGQLVKMIRTPPAKVDGDVSLEFDPADVVVLKE